MKDYPCDQDSPGPFYIRAVLNDKTLVLSDLSSLAICATSASDDLTVSYVGMLACLWMTGSCKWRAKLLGLSAHLTCCSHRSAPRGSLHERPMIVLRSWSILLFLTRIRRVTFSRYVLQRTAKHVCVRISASKKVPDMAIHAARAIAISGGRRPGFGRVQDAHSRRLGGRYSA